MNFSSERKYLRLAAWESDESNPVRAATAQSENRSQRFTPREQVRGMGICEVLAAPRSPWQRAYVERVIGSFAVSASIM